MLDNYEVGTFVVIHQIDFTPIEYDNKNISYQAAEITRDRSLEGRNHLD